MALTAGTNIGQYKIIARLGSGGMGEVYLAQDLRLKRKVALKLLFENVTKNEDWVRRFEQEALAASALKLKAEYANTLALSGDASKAQTELNSLIELSKQKYISAYHIAAIYVSLKDKDHAFEWLEKAFQDRADWMAFLKVDPRFDSLHSEQRFTVLLRRMNLG